MSLSCTCAIVCSCLSFLNPILLVNNYKGAKEKTRKMAKAMDKNGNEQRKKTKEVKEQWASFVKIELGKIKLNFGCLILTFLNLPTWENFFDPTDLSMDYYY